MKKEELSKKGNFLFKIHKIIFSTMNIIFVISNIWLHGFPWSFVILVLWGIIFLNHKHFVKISKSNDEQKKGFWNNLLHAHIITFVGIAVLANVCYLFLTCNDEFGCQRFRVEILIIIIPKLVWTGILALHIIWQKGLLCFKKRENLVILPVNTTTSVNDPVYDEQIDLEDHHVINK